MTNLRKLAQVWREEALILEKRYADPRAAELFRLHAQELEEAVQGEEEEVLTLEAAAAVSGYSGEYLRHQVAEGKIPNAGERGRPRIRRADLPVKPGPRERPTGNDAAATARSIRHPVGGKVAGG